ncbi:MAG: MFS transporter [Acholeplasmataceae bacterium]|jgi:MFS family permease|nr:MFS transporter [Acholeplasmataceae bacterium]
MKLKTFLLLLIIYITFIALGLPDALLGSAWNLIRFDLNTSLETLGLMTIIVYIMSILSTFNAPRLMRKFETKYITGLSVLFTGLALIGISFVTSFYQMLFFAIPLGIGAGAIDVSLNHYLASNYEAKHMSYLHSFYGIGVTLGPTIMAYTLNQNEWRLGYIIVGALLILIAIFIASSFKLWRKENHDERQQTHQKITVKDILKTKGALFSILIFLIYVHIESLGGVWIASYFFIEKDVSYAVAALFTTTFYLALTIGRLLSGMLSSRFKPNHLIHYGQILMLISGLLMWFEFSTIYIYFMIVFLLGLGAGPIYPNMMYMNALVFEKHKLSKIISLQMAIGYMGFGILTPLAGLFFGNVSIAYYPLFIGVMTLILITITFIYRKQTIHQ